MEPRRLTPADLPPRPQPILNTDHTSKTPELDAIAEAQKVIRRLEDIDAGKIKGRRITQGGYNLLSQVRQQKAANGELSSAATKAVLDAEAKRQKKRDKRKKELNNGE